MKILKTEGDVKLPASAYLVVEDAEKPSTWHLRIGGESGLPDPAHMGAAWAALHEGYRGEKYAGPQKEEALAKLKKLYAALKRDTPDVEKKEYDGSWSELTWKEAPSFGEWLIRSKEDAPVEPNEAVDPKALHLRVGRALAKFGLKPSKAIDTGEHAEAHGSAWVAPKTDFEKIKTGLWDLGYRPKGKGKYFRGPVMIETGQDAENLYLYITDDNGPAQKKAAA